MEHTFFHPITASAFVKEVSVNDSTSKNDKDVYTQSSPILLPQAPSIKTHVVKTTIPPQQPPSKNNGSKQQVSLPISDNNNNYYHHHYTHTLTNSTQNVNSSPISAHLQLSSSVKYLSNKNSTMIIT
jgi:hypothetical protein